MDIVVSPVSVMFNAQSGGNAPALQAGEIIEALVLRLIDATRAQLSIANTIIEVQTKVSLVPGTIVHLAVKSTPEGLKLVLLREGERPVQSLPQPINSPVAPSARASAASAPTEPAEALPTGPAAALLTAVRSSAALQNGLAPLLADAAVAAKLAGLPEPVRQAAIRLLALRVPLDGALTADDLRQAFSRSGLFLETRLATTPTGVNPMAAGDLKAALVVFRQVLSSWLGEPEPAPQAAPQAVAQTTPRAGSQAAPQAGSQATLQAVPQAVPQAAPQAPSPAARPTPSPPDLPAGQIVATNAPASAAGSAPAAFAASASVAAPGAASAAQSLYRAVAQALPLPESAGSAIPRGPAIAAAPLAAKGEDAPLADPAATAGRRPPPPYRGAAPAAQPPAEASIPAAPREAARLLLAETDAALARHTLLQAASLPDRAEPGDPARPCWTFEVPFATPRGTAIAQFEISRDGHARPADGVKPVWRARFSLDIEPMGAVHAQVALSGARASVTLWAEREDSAAQLRASSALLADALRAADLDPGDVLVRGGQRPRDAAAPAGRFLDRAS